jgi:hypothetical protein
MTRHLCVRCHAALRFERPAYRISHHDDFDSFQQAANDKCYICYYLYHKSKAKEEIRKWEQPVEILYQDKFSCSFVIETFTGSYSLRWECSATSVAIYGEEIDEDAVLKEDFQLVPTMENDGTLSFGIARDSF